MAALDFPDSPSGGDTYAGYVYNATKGVWQWEVVDPSVASLSDTDITSPTSGDVLQYDGTDWVNAAGVGGKILQVVSAIKTDSFTTSSTSFVPVTGLTASITPSSSSSKILVSVSFGYGLDSSTAAARFNLTRGGTAIAQPTSGGVSEASINVFPESINARDQATFIFLDSPATTSSTTYGLEMLVSSGTGYLGRGAADHRSPSTITVMEVAG